MNTRACPDRFFIAVET